MRLPGRNQLKRILSPRSLRSQLLARSLFILAMLLLLIGGVQYFVMKNFLYNSRAETMVNQLRSMPVDLLVKREQQGSSTSSSGGQASPNGAAPSNGGASSNSAVPSNGAASPAGESQPAGSTGQNPPAASQNNTNNNSSSSGSSSGSSSDQQNQGRGTRPILFTPPDTSLGYIQDDGTYVSLTQSTETGYPVLSSSEYAQILEEWKAKKNIKYRIVRDNDGNEQLIVFRPSDSPVNPIREGYTPQSGQAAASGNDERITGLVQMGTETAPLLYVAMRQLVIFIILSILAMAGGLLLYMPVIRRTLVPLNQIVQALGATDAGNLKQRIPDQLGQEEIDRLASSYNGMLERLELSFEAEREAKEQMRRFTADASHELRTPLTSIHGFLEVLLRSPSIKPEQLKSALTSMHGESVRMKKLIEDLLMLAKLDRAPELTLTSIRLDELVMEMEPHLRMLSGERNVSFDLTAGLHGKYNKDKLKQVILNLFQNAVQHTDAATGSIHVALTSVKNGVILSVSDNGPGIPDEHLPHVFERFYRSDVSRARKRGGAGLGLAISMSMVEAHNGTITVQTKVGEGTTFSVHLPNQLNKSAV